MKKKLCIYILFMFISLFIFSGDVSADNEDGVVIQGVIVEKTDAKELVCNYQGGIMLVQYATGTKVIKMIPSNLGSASWATLKDYVSWNSEKWEMDKRTNITISGDDSKYYENGNFTSCPKFVTYNSSEVKYQFTDSKVKGANSKQYSAFKSPTFSEYAEYYDLKTEITSNDSVEEGEVLGVGTTCNKINFMTNYLFDASSYDYSCVYSKKLGSNCVVVQMAANDSGEFKAVYSPDAWSNATLQNSIKVQMQTFDLNLVKPVVDSTSYIEAFNSSNQCPNLYMGTSKDKQNTIFNMTFSFKEEDGDRMSVRNFAVGAGANSTLAGENYFDLVDEEQKIENLKCEDIFTEDIKPFVKGIITLLRIAVPLILIGMGVADFGSAVFAGSEDNMKKAQSKFIKRLLIGVVVFLVPVFLRIILGIAYNIWGVVDPSLCGLI